MFVSQLAGALVPMHGLGGGKDLPIPANLAIVGGSAALIVSFCILLLAWKAPRYDDPASSAGQGRRVPRLLATVAESTALAISLRAFGVAAFAFFVWALLEGPDLVTNPIFGMFYVLLWVGIVPASLIFGRAFRAVSPLRTFHLVYSRVFRSDPSRGLAPYPERLGYWPAALGLFAFVWQELVNDRSVYAGSLRFWVAYYIAIMGAGVAVYGDRWLARADPFEVYSSLLAKLSFWSRRDDGTLVWRSPLANLATLKPAPGVAAVVAVLLGSTAFDSFKDSVTWVKVLTSLNIDAVVVNTVGLIGFCLFVWTAFCLATMATRKDPDSDPPLLRRQLPSLLAHSVVPIIVGYMTAHYLSFFVEVGQATLIQMSDPMVNGSNILGTGNWTINYWLSYNPTALATIKVLAVVTGHVVGVIAAHDRVLRILPRKHQVVGQLGLLLVMVGFTLGGLYLLFGA